MLKDVKVGSLLNVILGLFVLVVVGLGFADWWISREDRREQQQVLAQAARVVPEMDSAYIGTLRSSGTLVGLMGGVLGGGAGSGSVSADDLRRVADILKSAEASMQRARQVPLPEATARQFNEVVTAFNALVSGSVQPLLDALTRRDAAAAQRAVQGVIPGSSRLLAARDAFRLSTEQMVSSFEESQAREETISLITLIVVVIVALLLFILGRWSLQRNLVRPLQAATQWCDRIAQGDLTTRTQHDHKNEVGQLLDALRRMQESLGRTVSSVRLGVDEIHRGAGEISAGNTDLSSRTEQQAASLQETAASMEQFASAVKQNADNARQANQLAAGASDIAQRGGHVVSDVVDTMRGISGSSNKIAEIVGVIDSIAFQTNILALNAAVEAARAGEQGKGFAVVAGEVRSLAQRSAQAAREIKGLIDDSVTKVSEGSQLVERAGSTMNDIVVAVQRVTDLMGEISAASEEQATGIEQVNRAIGQMDEVTQRNAALVEEAAAAANHLGESAQQLRTAVAVFALNEGDVLDVVSPRLPGVKHAAAPAARLARAPAPSALPGKAAGRASSATAQLSSPTKPAAARAGRPAQTPAASASVAPRAAVTARPSAASARAPKDDDDWESF